MNDEAVQGIEGSDLEESGLQEQISHWVTVLNRWVEDLDRGLGRQIGEPQPADEIGADS